MEENKIPDSKIYELALNTKNHTEDRRDEINKYYPSLFSAIIVVMPFLGKFNQTVGNAMENDSALKIALIFLSIIGISISFSWILTLKRIYYYLEGIDKFLMEIENKNERQFISFLSAHLTQAHSPSRVTKQTMIVPYTFIAIFLASLSYSLFPL